MITGKRVFEGCGGGIKASSGNPDWLKGAMRDYERIYLRFSAAAAACHCRRRWRCWYCNISTWIGVQITKKRGGEREKEEREGRNPHPRGDIKKDKLVAARGMAIPKSYGRGVSRNVVLSESGPRFLVTGSTLGLAYKLTEIWHVYTYMEISSFHFVEIRFVVASSCSSLPREWE